MFGADVMMTEAARFLHGMFEYLLRIGREFDVIGIETR